MVSPDLPKKLALGVDLGGTKIYTLLADATGRVFSECTVPTPAGCGEREVLDSILVSLMQVLDQAAKELAPAEGRGDERRPGQDLPAAFPAEIERCLLLLGSAGYPVIGLGIGVAGVVSSCGNIIRQAPNLGWKDVYFRERLENAVGLPVRMDNDTNLAAWGEYLYGDHGRPDSLIYVGIGTGIGGGLVIDGRLYRGTSGGAGEIGHTVVEPAGPVCSLGHPGCLEAMASGLAIARAARQEVKNGRGDSLLPYADGEPRRLTAKAVGKALADGNPRAAEILGRVGTYLGIGLSSVINILNPALIVIGGGVAELSEAFMPNLVRELELRAFPALRQAVRIEKASLGRRAGALGASALVFTEKGVE